MSYENTDRSYYGNPLDNFINNIKTGDSFEESFIKSLKKTFHDTRSFKIIQTTNTKLDYEQGTDVIYKDKYNSTIRLDPTLNFSGQADIETGRIGDGKPKSEKHMPFLLETGIPAFPNSPYNFKMGIRIGVTHKGLYKDFEEPVIVVGLDMDPKVYDKYSTMICEQMDRRMRDIINVAEDCLTDYNTMDPKDREELWARPLEPNPDFRSNRFMGPTYKSLNKVDHSDHQVPSDYYNYTK
jgi:hypothetical protein